MGAGQLAIDGGTPVREEPLPYGRQTVGDGDIAAVEQVLRSGWLTTGPAIETFEKAITEFTGAGHAVALSSGTAALHAMTSVLELGPGDEVIVPSITFAATANAAVFVGATPVFADVDSRTLLIDPESVAALITPSTRAIIAVDYAGQPADYDALESAIAGRQIELLSDSCHAVGSSVDGSPVCKRAGMTTLSFHPVKHLTTAEGGMVLTDRADWAARARAFRSHGMNAPHQDRTAGATWIYEIDTLGYNYRMSDIHAALGRAQIDMLPEWISRRRRIAEIYDGAFAASELCAPLQNRPGVVNSYHLYVLRLALTRLTADRQRIFEALHAEGIRVNVHYIPVHLLRYYRDQFGTSKGQCPVAEKAYQEIISLPIFPAMSDGDVADVVTGVNKVLEHCRR